MRYWAITGSGVLMKFTIRNTREEAIEAMVGSIKTESAWDLHQKQGYRLVEVEVIEADAQREGGG